jgi:hypothetical protein
MLEGKFALHILFGARNKRTAQPMCAGLCFAPLLVLSPPVHQLKAFQKGLLSQNCHIFLALATERNI